MKIHHKSIDSLINSFALIPFEDVAVFGKLCVLLADNLIWWRIEVCIWICKIPLWIVYILRSYIIVLPCHDFLFFFKLYITGHLYNDISDILRSIIRLAIFTFLPLLVMPLYNHLSRTSLITIMYISKNLVLSIIHGIAFLKEENANKPGFPFRFETIVLHQTRNVSLWPFVAFVW